MRSIVTILAIVNEAFGGILGEIPGYNTVGNWVKKYGLDVYNSSGESLKGKDYAGVTDESMMIGSEKLIVTLGIPSEHQGRPLCQEDAIVLDMAVAKSWTGEGVKTQLEKAAQKVGHAPEYVISDNASIMSKGMQLTGINHHRDISHSIGMCLESIYKKADDFKAYVKEMTDVKFKHNMKKVAYLLPPTQRAIARFINLSGWVKWSRKMLNIYHKLTPDEQSIFSFIPANTALINELSEVVDFVENIESICKQQGFSRKTVTQCQFQISEKLLVGSPRMIQFGWDMLGFLKAEASMLKSDTEVHNNSSDILESIFGTYKARKSPNKLHGVTPFILFIPAHTQLLKNKSGGNYLFKERLERTRLKQIDEWARENLTSNLVALRTKTLKCAA